MKLKLRLWVLGFIFSATQAVAQTSAWIPPAGTPMPPFGVVEVAPAPTLTLDPGAVIPQVLPAGTVVQLTGANTQTFSSPNQLIAQGTSDHPVFIRGGVYANTIEITGTYFIIELCAGHGVIVRDSATAATHHFAVRDCDETGGGIFALNWYGFGTSYGVFLRDKVHDFGDLLATNDPDNHGYGLTGSDHIWLLNSDARRVSGDGIQVNGDSTKAAQTHHIYIGRNTFDTNRQSGVWIKWASDVVVSSNVIRHMYPDQSGENPGVCGGAQYAALRTWWILNDCGDSANGFRFAGFDPGVSTPLYVLSNTIHGIHGPGTVQDPQSPGTAIILDDGQTRLVANNTLVDVDTGVGIPNSGGDVTLVNNIFAKTARAPILVESPLPTVLHNLFDVAPAIAPQGTPQSTGNFAADPQLQPDYTLGPTSPALNAGTPINVADYFFSLHGVPLGLVLTGTPNIGALLAGVITAPPPPVVPPPPPPVVTPPPPVVPPPLPKCPHTLRGFGQLILRQCNW